MPNAFSSASFVTKVTHSNARVSAPMVSVPFCLFNIMARAVREGRAEGAICPRVLESRGAHIVRCSPGFFLLHSQGTLFRIFVPGPPNSLSAALIIAISVGKFIIKPKRFIF